MLIESPWERELSDSKRHCWFCIVGFVRLDPGNFVVLYVLS
jgi:hypothetical protein